MHTISVIIPIYNTAEFLPRCLDSVLNNTYRELEVICINDGSPDNSLDILKGYAANDSRIRIINQKNAGVSVARNRGLDEATGEYIAFVDSDDWIHRQYFEILLRCMHESGADIQVCGEHVTSVLTPDPQFGPEHLQSTVLNEFQALENGLSACKRLYRREVIRGVRFVKDMRFGEDRVFNMEIYRANRELRVAQITAPMYNYFMRPGSAVHSLHPREVKPLVLWYRDHLDGAPGGDGYRYYLIDAAKKLLSWRYSIRYLAEPGERELVKDLIRMICGRILHGESLNLKDKLIYGALIKVPGLYRLFRILSDPTMLGWEKQQRQKAKAEKNKK